LEQSLPPKLKTSEPASQGHYPEYPASNPNPNQTGVNSLRFSCLQSLVKNDPYKPSPRQQYQPGLAREGRAMLWNWNSQSNAAASIILSLQRAKS